MTRLGIQLDVQTLLGGYYPISGEYGLQIDVTGIVGPAQDNEAYNITQTFIFNNKDMYGNSYAYYQFYTQQKIVDISSFLSVSKVDVYFIQEFDFYDESGMQIPYQQPKLGDPLSFVAVPDNIFIRNIEAYFGVESSELNEERVFFFTHNSMYYNANLVGETEEETLALNTKQDTKTLQLNWIHIKDDNSGTILFKNSTELEEFNKKLLQSIMDQSEAEEITATEAVEYRNRQLQVFVLRENLALSEANGASAEVLGPLYLAFHSCFLTL